jgi:phosphatidylglycerol:prolipoprotein diacylglycerol transferase
MKPIIDFGLFRIPTFYLVLSISLSIVLYFFSDLIEKNKSYDRKTAFDLALVVMFFGFFGGRLLHVIYEAPQYYAQYPSQIFQFWNGGFVYFGGMILALIASLIFLKSRHENFYRWADIAAPALSLMYALGRIGCFFEGCCYGSYCTLPWAINERHPTQLYMVFAELLVFFFILLLKNEQNGKVFFTWLVGHGLCRFIIEFYRDDDRGQMAVNILSISQVISLFVIIISLYFLKKIQSNKSSSI